MKDLTFNISETSRITGLSIDTLRYYDKIGLIQSKKNKKCPGDRSNPGSFAGSAGSKCIEAACEDLDAKLQAAINFVIIDWSIS